MAQQKTTAEINKFVGGLFTDASPLTFPENTSSVDINFELNSDGSRQRALGLAYEQDYAQVTTSVTSADSLPIAFNVYRWENVGGDPLKTIVCVQFGNEVKFFDSDDSTLSTNLIQTISFPSASVEQKFSFAAVDGNLVVATGTNLITTIIHSSGVLTQKTDFIRVRDFFGVQDFNGSDDLTNGQGLQKRPSTLSTNHQYNLRNQGFGIPRMSNNGDSLVDPITAFTNAHAEIKGSTKYPSNSDAVSEFLYADAGDTDDRNSKRYFSKDAVKNPLGTARAAQGYYIIDLLNRGSSRKTEDAKNHSNYSELTFTLGTLPTDRTPGGATVVGEFGGRVWYGGFSGEVTGGDDKSPQLSSYITFSQLVNNPTMITLCYQTGDPTSDVEPDIIDTDGGFIRLNNAYGIKSMTNLGSSFMVGAANGIWRIYGGNDSGFTATNYVVSKVTDKGVRGAGSVVQVENTIMYWADDGIYHLTQNQFGEWVSENRTQGRIQKFYDAIPIEDKASVIGTYDSFQRKVRWIYGNRLYGVTQQKELIFDINLGAFYERHISQVDGNSVPVAVGSFNTNTFKVNEVEETVTVGGVVVTVGGDPVVVTTATRSSITSLFEIGYVAVTQISPVVKYTFAAYTNPDFIDWKEWNGVGVDAPATLVTGTGSGGDNMRYKQIPYLYVHLRRTENGFEDDGTGSGDIKPVNESSCTVQSIWDWTNSINSNKWGVPFQAYRYRRLYFPVDVNDDFDTGHETIITKNKLRGRGRAISFKFTSEPLKEMHIYGWSFVMGMNSNV